MRYRYLIGAGVALAAMLSWADARAQLWLPPAGGQVWYFGAEGGWTNLEDQTFKLGPVRLNERFNDGYNVGARTGIEWGPWRFEEEFRYQKNGYNRLDGIAVQGDRTAYAFMTNAIYDFGISGWGITPHIGAGIGVVVQRDGMRLPKSSSPATGLEITHGTSVDFGYQGIAGIRYNINPSLAFDLDYRYLATADDGSFRTSPQLGNLKTTSGYNTHNFVASLSWRFGPPAPPPAAAPLPPAPPPMRLRPQHRLHRLRSSNRFDS